MHWYTHNLNNVQHITKRRPSLESCQLAMHDVQRHHGQYTSFADTFSLAASRVERSMTWISRTWSVTRRSRAVRAARASHPRGPGPLPRAREGHRGAREARGGEVITDRCHVVLIIPAHTGVAVYWLPLCTMLPSSWHRWGVAGEEGGVRRRGLGLVKLSSCENGHEVKKHPLRHGAGFSAVAVTL